MCVSTAALPPPLSERPAGCELQAKPALNSFSEPEPATGFPFEPQATWMVALLEKTADGSPQPFHATLEIGENSPKFGARNEVPQVPRIIRPISCDTSQLKD